MLMLLCSIAVRIAKVKSPDEGLLVVMAMLDFIIILLLLAWVSNIT